MVNRRLSKSDKTRIFRKLSPELVFNFSNKHFEFKIGKSWICGTVLFLLENNNKTASMRWNDKKFAFCFGELQALLKIAMGVNKKSTS